MQPGNTPTGSLFFSNTASHVTFFLPTCKLDNEFATVPLSNEQGDAHVRSNAKTKKVQSEPTD